MNLIALRDVPSSTGAIAAGREFKADDEHGEQLIRAGLASRADAAPLKWTGLEWPSATVVVLASGASLTADQCRLVQEWRESAGAAGAAPTCRRCIVVNTTFRLAPWADVLYACDAPWWRVYHAEVERTFGGQLWTQDIAASRELAVRHIQSARGAGLGKRPGVINQGGNGGFQAVNLAYQAGAARIVLVGFDMGGTHWHGRYDNGLPNTPERLFPAWIKDFAALATDLSEAGVVVRNCTAGGRLECFERTDLSKELS